MKLALLLIAVSAAVCGVAQVVPQASYERHGFDPYWKLGAEPQFECVGRFDGGKSSGVWLGGRYVLYVMHGTGTQGKGICEPVDPTKKVFVLEKNGKDHRFRGARWHLPRAGWMIDAGTSSAVAELYTTVTTAVDFCVLELAEIPNVPGLKPARIFKGDEEAGMNAVWVGYGIRGTSTGGYDEGRYGWGGGDRPTRRFAFENRIEGANRWGWILWSKFEERGLPLEGHQSPGSSGGGVFAKVGDEWFLIAGAANGKGSMDQQMTKTGSAFGSLSGGTRISRWRRELEQGLRGDWTSFEAIGTSRFNGLSVKG